MKPHKAPIDEEEEGELENSSSQRQVSLEFDVLSNTVIKIGKLLLRMALNPLGYRNISNRNLVIRESLLCTLDCVLHTFFFVPLLARSSPTGLKTYSLRRNNGNASVAVP